MLDHGTTGWRIWHSNAIVVMHMGKVIITSHAKKRLLEGRQRGISIEDIIRVAKKIPGKIPIATRFRGFISTNGQIYDIVAKDIPDGRLVITVIGKK